MLLSKTGTKSLASALWILGYDFPEHIDIHLKKLIDIYCEGKSPWWGQGGLNLPPPVPLTPASGTFYSRFRYLLLPLPVPFTPASRPFPWWCPPLCLISIAKYNKTLRNFTRFLPVSTTLGIPLPAPFLSVSRPLSPSTWYEERRLEEILANLVFPKRKWY